MRVQLHLIRLLFYGFNLPLFSLCVLKDKLLPFFVSLIKNLQKFLNFLFVVALPQEFLGLSVKLVILLGCLLQFLLDFLGFISGLDDLLLKEHLFSLLFVDLELPLFDGFLVHLRHIPQEQSLLSDLAELGFKRFNFFVLQL